MRGIMVCLDVVLAQKKVRGNELARAVGITPSNLSLLKSGKVRGVRFDTLAAICDYLDCEPGDILQRAPPDSDADSVDPPIRQAS
ncbi:MAG: helix-turn-helix transcriptional regulator [Pseudomonadota bacterium]